MDLTDQELMDALGFSSFGGPKQATKPTGASSASTSKAYHGSVSSGGFFGNKAGTLTNNQTNYGKHKTDVGDAHEELTKKRKVEPSISPSAEQTVVLPSAKSSAPPAANLSSLVSYDDSSDEDSDFGPSPAPQPKVLISAPSKVGSHVALPSTAPPTTASALPAPASATIASAAAPATSTVTSIAASAAADDSDSDDDYGPMPASASTTTTAPPAAATSASSSISAAPTKASSRVTGEVEWESEGDYSDSDDEAPSVHDISSLSSDAALKAGDSALQFTGTAAMPLHTRNVVSLASDRAGSRVYTAGVDGYVHLCDFNRMDERMKPSKSVLVQEGHAMARVRYSPVNGLVLAITGGQQPVVLDKELNILHTCAKGYPYIMDLSHTKGHKAGCTDGHWHPSDPSEFITSGHDGTVRVWRVSECAKTCSAVLKPRVNLARKVQNVQNVNLKRQGQEMSVSTVGNLNSVTACCYNAAGDVIALACVDGSVHVYKHGKKASHLSAEYIFELTDMVVTDMRFSALNDALLVIRGGEGSAQLCVYDTRSKRMLATLQGLPNDSTGDVCFHPSGGWLAVALNRRVKQARSANRDAEEDTASISASAQADLSASIAKVARSMVAEALPRAKPTVKLEVKGEEQTRTTAAEDIGEATASDIVVKAEPGTDGDAVKREDAVYDAAASTYRGEDAVYGGEDATEDDLLRHAIFDVEAGEEDEDTYAATGQGMIVIVRVSDWTVQAALRTSAPVTSVLWSGYGQLFAGRADGVVECLYDAAKSADKKGVLLCVGKKGREREVRTDFTVAMDYDNIFSGGESGYLTLHGRVQRPKRGQITKDTVAKPAGSSKGHVNNTNITHQFMKQFIGNTKEAFLQTDPREALLRHAKKQ